MWWGLAVAVICIIAINFFMGRHFLNKLKELFGTVEKDLRAGRHEKAVERLKEGYKYANWQFFVKEQINAQIGIILYSTKKFDEALVYLEKGFNKNWLCMSMLAASYYRRKDTEKALKTLESAVKSTSKEGFLYSFYAWMLSGSGNDTKAIEVLNKGVAKCPLDEKLEANMEGLKNGKKVKMERYGNLWLQLQLAKMPEGAKPYQQFLANQRVKRR
jgi:tetratricopeptide (TPR) repeat protein